MPELDLHRSRRAGGSTPCEILSKELQVMEVEACLAQDLGRVHDLGHALAPLRHQDLVLLPLSKTIPPLAQLKIVWNLISRVVCVCVCVYVRVCMHAV